MTDPKVEQRKVLLDEVDLGKRFREEYDTDELQKAARKHEHDRLDVVSVPKGRALLCHVCEKPVAHDRGVSNRGA